jgi:predicted metal-dependent enzyme (double-stranded beta helix superfamily)
MNELYQYISNHLLSNKTLKELKENLSLYITDEVTYYCKKQCVYIPNTYNKIKLHDYSNDYFEFILICWNTDCQTKIHDHPSNGCVFYLIDGELQEYLYKNNKHIKKITTINKGQISYMDNNLGYHKIKCKKKGFSLHIYSPSNYKMNIIE